MKPQKMPLKQPTHLKTSIIKEEVIKGVVVVRQEDSNSRLLKSCPEGDINSAPGGLDGIGGVVTLVKKGQEERIPFKFVREGEVVKLRKLYLFPTLPCAL